jgi:L-glyceraldehyde 3-phosphate reductase
MMAYRDELCISTKAGYDMWEGPYGDKNGSRKYLISSLDQSLRRMGLEYVDIYYHHIFDPDTPLEETALALDHCVRQGKALYVGVSNYNAAQTAEIAAIFRQLHTPFLVNQPSYSMLNRWIEADGLDTWAKENGCGISVYSPLAQGFLTDRYLHGIPEDSRIGKGNRWMRSQLTAARLDTLRRLHTVAEGRGQTLSQMALCWVLHNEAITTVLIGASRPSQIVENVQALEHLTFTPEEIRTIEDILNTSTEGGTQHD